MKKTLLTAIYILLSPFLLTSQNGGEGVMSTISRLFTSGDGGLSSSKITCIAQEDNGSFWIGTEDGLNRFDGYNFRVYRKRHDDTLSLAANHITALFQDSRQRMWIATAGGLGYYEPSSDGFVSVSLNQPDSIVRRNICSAIIEDSRGWLWFALPGTGALRYLPETGESLLLVPSPQGEGICSEEIAVLAEDGGGNIWLGSRDKGVSVYDPQTGAFRTYDISNSGLPDNTIFDLRLLRNGNMLAATLKRGVAIFDAGRRKFAAYADVFDSPYTRYIRCTVEDADGNILVGTEGKGVFIFDPDRRELRKYPIPESSAHVLDDAKISSLYIGHHGYLWAGLKYKGVLVVGSEQSGFRTISKVNDSAGSLNYNYVTGITTDKDGDIWIATDGGGLNRYRPAKRTFTHYTHRRGDPGSLKDNAALSVFCDSRNRIWTGTYSGGISLFNRQTETFAHFASDDGGRSDGLRRYHVRSIQEDKQGNIWLGARGGGLKRFDVGTKSFASPNIRSGVATLDEDIDILLADSLNRLWIGANSGLSRLDIETGAFVSYGEGSGLHNIPVYSLAESPGGLIWAGTTDGLYAYSPAEDAFSKVYPSDREEAAVVNGLVYDGGLLWMSTNSGVVSYSVNDAQTRAYSRSNSGVGSDEFLRGSYYKSPAGEIFFGGVEGVSVFFPNEIRDSVTIQKVYITNLSISGEPVGINREVNGRIVLDTNISETKRIKLLHSDRYFRLDFVAMGSFKPYSTIYACMLEGFDKEWSLHNYSDRSVTYTNLNPGVYVFRVKASNDPDRFDGEEASLIIEVAPPVWKTWWAKLLYVLLSAGVTLFITLFVIARLRERSELLIERMSVKQQEELNSVRLNFFTNITHELRTPLTLIIGPLRKIVGEDTDEERKKAGNLVLRNAERLQHRINQILDFKKIEEGKMKLHVRPVEIVTFVANCVAVFRELMRQKNITVYFSKPSGGIEIWYDPDMLEMCLNNIMYNAFKFTLPGGSLSVAIEAVDGGTMLSFRDTGVGMNRETSERIFDRFYQGSAGRERAGAGLGLHLTKTIVEMHGCDISVESREGEGSCFTIVIPEGNKRFSDKELAPVEAVERDHDTDVHRETAKRAGPAPAAATQPKDAAADERPTLLLVEDNSDMRFYIRRELSDENYIIEEAADGKEGLDMALRITPDLVIADVMMPRMSGTELCRILKSTPQTCHIPIVILTARDDMPNRMESIESGADSFIAKPFDVRYLRARISRLIETRRVMKERFGKSIFIDTQELHLTSLDERLMTKTIDYIRANMENTELSVEEMSRELGLSRAHLHRKIKALTGKSPVEFIRMMRMKHAAFLLGSGKLSISEVAYMTGYNTPSYFSASFGAFFGMPPKTYMEKIIRERKERGEGDSDGANG
ncbi:MAG: response regulator [Tannerellaceae bacterium]|jgi:signal transduction histidine kinase/ligand-binding sensor domain-containing protein/DNA-binding response OmpR family regulator|nr:response regulator [Tannerellaceae bacterium]